MKRLHRDDLFSYSVFDEPRDIDFNTVLWVRAGGNVLIDPLPLTPHDRAHLAKLGGAAWIVVTNSDHVRASEALARDLRAKIAGPRAERETFPLRCDAWLGDGDAVVPGLVAHELAGSKTPGELMLALDDTTLIFGDVVRSHRAGAFMFLPPDKLKDKRAAVRSVRHAAEGKGTDAVLVGDGFSAFGNGRLLLDELLEREGAHADDSGEFRIPASRRSIPAPPAAAACSFCGRADVFLVSGEAGTRGKAAALCASCAPRLAVAQGAARCDFCDQEAPEVARQGKASICRGCLDLALEAFQVAGEL